MIEWSDYLSNLLSSENDFVDLTISLDDGQISTEVPPIIRASISMLEKMTKHQGTRNILVFPEKMQSVFIFTLMYLFHSISKGKIQSNYDPTEFTVGEKLKVGSSIVEFSGFEKIDGIEYCFVKTSDYRYGTPVEYMPIFQKVKTKKKLSKGKKFSEEKEAACALLNNSNGGNRKLAYISEMKTHMDSSVFVMTSVKSAKEQLSDCIIDGRCVSDIFYFGQVNYEGIISNVSAGQMSGVPAMVFASDLYAINAAAERNNQIQSVIIDASNSTMLLNQLDFLDKLLARDIPILCVTDVANSFDLKPFSARKFNIWRWDGESITKQLYDAVPLASDKKIKNCAKHNISYLTTDGMEISDAMRLLSAHRQETKDQSPGMMRLFEKLNRLTFSILRTTVSPQTAEQKVAYQTLEECRKLLAAERQFLNDATIADYTEIINDLQIVYARDFVLKKNEVLKDFIKEHDDKSLYLVIPEGGQKSAVQDYWNNWCEKNHSRAKVMVLFPSEYYVLQAVTSEITVICGWLKRAIMRKIIYSYNTSQYVILLYDYENRWKNHDSRKWKAALDNAENKTIIDKSFSSEKAPISTKHYELKSETDITHDSTDLSDEDELEEIELTLRENTVRKYTRHGSSGSSSVIAIPVSFVGGYVSFYRNGHHVISATGIITADAEQIETKLPSQLQIGDFVVVRETDRDIIRELADLILENSGKSDLRRISSKWREALQIETLFYSTETIYEKIRNAGCDKGLATVKRWVEDEDVIAPRSKDDLRIIAEVTENELLMECLDEIFDAAQEVRIAHQVAGRKLSEQLRKTLAKKLQLFDKIDPFNFWEPIDIEIEDIGNVKVLKIIDIGAEIAVDSTDTNRLISD